MTQAKDDTNIAVYFDFSWETNCLLFVSGFVYWIFAYMTPFRQDAFFIELFVQIANAIPRVSFISDRFVGDSINLEKFRQTVGFLWFFFGAVWIPYLVYVFIRAKKEAKRNFTVFKDFYSSKHRTKKSNAEFFGLLLGYLLSVAYIFQLIWLKYDAYEIETQYKITSVEAFTYLGLFFAMQFFLLNIIRFIALTFYINREQDNGM